MAKTSFVFGDTCHELGTVPVSDGLQWILRLSEADDSDQEVVNVARVVSQRLDGLPLAVTQIISIIRMRQLRLPVFVKLYESETEQAEL